MDLAKIAAFGFQPVRWDPTIKYSLVECSLKIACPSILKNWFRKFWATKSETWPLQSTMYSVFLLVLICLQKNCTKSKNQLFWTRFWSFARRACDREQHELQGLVVVETLGRREFLQYFNLVCRFPFGFYRFQLILWVQFFWKATQICLQILKVFLKATYKKTLTL